MIIYVNGEPQEIKQQPFTVADLLVLNQVEMPEMVSVQLNGEFVKREDYQTIQINDGDEIDFLYFMGGGAR